MTVTRLRGGNAQFPETKSIGDVVAMANGDILCYDGSMWQLAGGRYIPKGLRETFLNYVDSGWPDEASANFDLRTILDLDNFVDYEPHETVPVDLKLVEKFISRVLEISARCDKARAEI